MPSIVDADRLSKTFQVKVRDPGLRGALRALLRPRYRDVHAVRDVTFGIDPGEIVAFLGPNGAGKTTTISPGSIPRSEEHTSELQSRLHLVCRLLLEKKKKPEYPTSPRY